MRTFNCYCGNSFDLEEGSEVICIRCGCDVVWDVGNENGPHLKNFGDLKKTLAYRERVIDKMLQDDCGEIEE